MSIRPILGVAQFGTNYGVTNINTVKLKTAKKILKFAKIKINTIDTAIKYKNSNKILRQINIKNFKINSKINLSKNPKNNSKKIFKHLKYLKINKLNVLFIHNVNEFLKMKDKKKVYSELMYLKKKKIFKKLGLSVYDINEVKDFMKLGKPDILQVPLNVLDRRFIKQNLISFFKKNKIKIQARSCFLQGLLIAKKIPNKFKKYNNIFIKWNKWCKKKKISRIKACLLFVKNNKSIFELVFGVSNQIELKEIFNYINLEEKISFPIFFKQKNKKLIDPRKW